MKIKSLTTTLLTLCAVYAAAPLASHAQEVKALLNTADRFRLGADNLQVDTQVTLLHADGRPDKERRYKVFAQAGRKSLVVMLSPSEKGQKVLMLGDDFWLLMPDSQRPLRITPMQKLLGDASTGDIASLRWADDYTGTLLGEEHCVTALAPQGGQACWHLRLQAARKGVSYQRVELWLGKAHGEPLKADLYVVSDKLAKQATFVLDDALAPTLVLEMVLTDQLSNHKTTHVRYLSRKERQVPAEWLTPMFLARNPALD